MFMRTIGRHGIKPFIVCAPGFATLFAMLFAVPLAAGETPESPDADSRPKSTSEAPASSSEIEQLRRMILEQQRQIDQLKRVMADQKSGDSTVAAKPDTSALVTPSRGVGEIASTSPILPPLPAVATVATPLPLPQAAAAEQPSPLQIHLGDSTITPVGFMDITNTWRSTNAGTSLQTNFGSFPYNNVTQGRLTEDKWSAENSRLGFRVDANVKGANVLGYFEGDFVGLQNAANNTQVNSNSMLFRIRQYYVDVRKGFWEVMAGQAWSMILPNRDMMSPLPADLFYTQVVDVNYTNGLYWGRIPGIRFIGHPNNKVTFGLALENSTQYFGGSGGGGVPTLPAALATAYNVEVDNSVNNDRTIPNVHPDIIGKFVVEPSSRFHFEVGGVESTVKTFNPLTQQYFTKAGGGVTATINAELVKNFRVITANYYNDGTGRYIFGAAPNFIV